MEYWDRFANRANSLAGGPVPPVEWAAERMGDGGAEKRGWGSDLRSRGGIERFLGDMTKKDIIGAVAIGGSVVVALIALGFFVWGGDSQSDAISAPAVAAVGGDRPNVAVPAVLAADDDNPRRGSSASTTVVPPPPPPPIDTVNQPKPQDGDADHREFPATHKEPPPDAVQPVAVTTEPLAGGEGDVAIAETSGTTALAEVPTAPVEPGIDILGREERASPKPPAEIPPDPSVALRIERLKALHQQRQTLRTEWTDANTLCQQVAQSTALAQQQIQQAKLDSTRLQVLYLQVESQRQAANKAGAIAQAATYRDQINQMKVQQAQLQNVHATATQQLPLLARQLAVAQKDLTNKQAECERFCPTWAEHYDPYGHLSRAHHEQTASLCETWLAEDNRFWEAYLLRGFAQLNLGQYGTAAEDFTTVINAAQQGQLAGSQHPELTRALAGRAMAHALRDREKDADADLATAGKIDQKSPLVHIYSGRVHAHFGRFRSACDDFLRAMKFNPTEPAGYREAAWLYATSTVQQASRAVALAKQACDLTDWKDWRCLDTYAVACAAGGDFDSASEWLKEAAAHAPPEAQAGIAQHAKLCEEKAVPSDPL